jgi:hypothetical protein
VKHHSVKKWVILYVLADLQPTEGLGSIPFSRAMVQNAADPWYKRQALWRLPRPLKLQQFTKNAI